jgi:WD40 repeat protein
VWLIYSPDGKTLVTATRDGKFDLWSAATGAHLQMIQGRPWCAAFAPDGQTLATVGAEEPTIHLWAAETGRKLRTLKGHETAVSSLAFSPDGKLLASGGIAGDTALRFWDASTGKQVGTLSGHSGQISSLEFARDSETLVSASMDEERVRLWRVSTGKEFRAFAIGEQPLGFHCTLSPDGKTLVLGTSRNCARLWDVATGKELHTGAAHQGAVYTVAVSRDGRTLATAGADGMIRLWDAATRNELRTLAGHESFVKAIAFVGDGKSLASMGGFDNTVRLWDVTTGKELNRLTEDREKECCLALSRDGRIAAWSCEGGTIRLRSIATGKDVVRLGEEQSGNNRPADRFTAAAFAPDGRRFTVVEPSTETVIRVWDLASGKELPQIRASDNRRFGAVAFSPDGRTLAATSPEGNVQLWEIATGKERLHFASPEAHLLHVSFAPDGRTVVTAANEGTIRLWDAATGKGLARLHGHRGGVRSAVFSPDARILISASSDTTALLWDVAGMKPMAADSQGGELDGWWADLAGADAARAYRAVAQLAVSKQTSSFLAARLQPVASVEAKQLAQLLAALDSDQFEVRRKGVAELEELGELAAPALRNLLKRKPSAEVVRSVEGLLEKLDGPIISARKLRLLRALEVLEGHGTPEARAILESLAQGAPEARVTQEAKASLERLAARPERGP